jgi:predicted DNA-binding protein (MmcQ/YjbR family)
LTVDALREYCLNKSGKVTEGFPFGEDILVFKVKKKIFLLLPLDVHPQTMNLKCDPERAIELRERYDAVQPGYHMNKKHWNTVVLDGSIPTQELRAMIDHSYDLVSGDEAARAKKGKKRKRREG